jgi:LysR family glycine cleavage system transcriptional activator
MSSLQAFDAAARTGSFTAAASELNLTQGAVSKQILTLEGMLDTALFIRTGHSVQLTESGRTYAKDVRKILEMTAASTLRVMTNPAGGVLELAVLPTFGTRWLMPRLPDFLRRNSGIQVNLTTKSAPFDFRASGLHAAIHYGTDDWSRAESTYLMGEDVVPLCSPSFKERHDLNEPADLVGLPLLNITSRIKAWPNWFEAQGIDGYRTGGMVFEQFLTAAQAAAVDLGVVLLPRFLMEAELERGELVLAVDAPYKSRLGYYLVVPKEWARWSPLLSFRDWLLETIAKDQQPANKPR